MKKVLFSALFVFGAVVFAQAQSDASVTPTAVVEKTGEAPAKKSCSPSGGASCCASKKSVAASNDSKQDKKSCCSKEASKSCHSSKEAKKEDN